MNRDEILARSRKENEGGDEMIKQLKLRAASVSRAFGFMLCVLGALVDSIFLESGLVGLICWVVYWGMRAVEEWLLFAGNKKKNGWTMAVVYTFFFAAFIVAFVIRLIEVV